MIPDGYVAFTTAVIGQRLVVHNLRPASRFSAPMFERSIPDNALEILLLPTGSMGSGSHSTTRLCLQLLEKHITPGCQVLDLGCGTGVLSIAAAKLGAGGVLAADIDAAAVETTDKNVALNGVDITVETRLAGLESVQPLLYDGLVANLLTPIILSLAPRGLALPVKQGGWAIFSGVLISQTEAVRHGLNAHGFRVDTIHTHGQWVALEATRNV